MEPDPPAPELPGSDSMGAGVLAGHSSSCPQDLNKSLGRGAPPSCPLSLIAFATSRDPKLSAHPPGGEAMRCQDSWNPGLLVPTGLWGLCRCELLPPPRQPEAQDGVTRMQACARWGMCLAGLLGRDWECVWGKSRNKIQAGGSLPHPVDCPRSSLLTN